MAKCHDSDTKKWNNLIDFNKKPSIVIKYSMGCFITINNKFYVLTCYHGIHNHIDVHIYNFCDKTKSLIKINATVKFISDELDLALLEINNNGNNGKIDFSDFQMLKMNDFNCSNKNNKSNKNNSNKTKYIIPVKEIKKDSTNFNVKKYNVTLQNHNNNDCDNNYTYDNLTSLNIPKLPYIKLSTKELSIEKIKKLKGVSGTIVFDNMKKIQGIVTNFYTVKDEIYVLTLKAINRFLNEIYLTNNFNGLCGIVNKKKLCEFEHDNVDYWGYMIVDKSIINYNNNICSTNNKYGNGLNYGDIIFQVNNHPLNDKGKIYDKEIDSYVPFNTYIALNYKNMDMIKLRIMRNEKNDYIEKKIKIKSRPLWTMKNIMIRHNNKFVNCNGIIFTELSEDIIEFYNNHNMIIDGYGRYIYTNKPYQDNGKKIIIAINLKKSELPMDFLKSANKIGFPLIKNYDNKYYFPILDKINRKKNFNLNDLNKIKKSAKYKLLFKLDNNFDNNEDNEKNLQIAKNNNNLSIKIL